MWFKKKKIEEVKPEEVKPEEVKTPEKSDWLINVEKLKAFRDVGEKFNYLGVEMIVTGHWDIDFPSYVSIYSMPSVSACLKVDYVTKNGEIKGGTFYIKDLEMLKKENPNLTPRS